MKRAPVVFAIALLLAGCNRNASAPARNESRADSLSDQDIIEALNKRLGAHACCSYAVKDKNGDGVYLPLKAGRELHVLIRRRSQEELIVCGYSGFPPVRSWNGQSVPSGDEQVFVVRGRQLYLERDVGDDEFEKMQDHLCGPDWVKPMKVQGIP